MTDEQRQSYIAALIRERAVYEREGKKDRVDAVDVELRKIGHSAAPPRKRAQTRQRKAPEAR